MTLLKHIKGVSFQKNYGAASVEEYKVIWYYQLSFKADVLSVSPLSELYELRVTSNFFC